MCALGPALPMLAVGLPKVLIKEEKPVTKPARVNGASRERVEEKVATP